MIYCFSWIFFSSFVEVKCKEINKLMAFILNMSDSFVIIIITRTRLLNTWTFECRMRSPLPHVGCWGADEAESMLANIFPVPRNSSETRASFAWNPIFKPKPWKKKVVQCGFYTKPGEALWFSRVLTWSQRELCVCLDLVLCFMFHLVLFPKPKVWGSVGGHRMNNMRLAWNLVQMKTAPAL